MTKRAEMGVGTLIIFIAFLIVASVAAGVLIQTGGSLQEKSLSTGQQSRTQISTNARVIEVSASDGTNGNLTDFRQIMKLAPGSDAMRLDQLIFTFSTRDVSSTLKYRGIGSKCEKNNQDGYNTWSPEYLDDLEIYRNTTLNPGGGIELYGADVTQSRTIVLDLDDDGLSDSMRICRNVGATYNCPGTDGSFEFNLTTDGLLYVIPVNNNGTVVDISNQLISFNFTQLMIGDYGYMSGFRTSGAGPYIISDVDPNIQLEFFESFTTLEEDLDDDQVDDHIVVNQTHLIIMLSSGDELSVDLGVDLYDPACLSIDIDNQVLQNSTWDNIAYVTIQAPCAGDRMIPEDSYISITPYRLREGYFSAIYETEGTNHIPGTLQRGDVLRLCYEAPAEIEEDELVRLNFIPKIGTNSLTEFVTPEVISVDQVFLYP